MSNSLQNPTQATKTQTKPSLFQGIINLEKSDKYQALSTDKKLELRGHLFDKFVTPYLKSKGVDVNDQVKERWVKANTGQPVTSKSPLGSPTIKEKALDTATHYYAQLGKGGIQTTRMLADLNQTALHFIGKHFPVRSLTPYEDKLLDKYDRWMETSRKNLNAREDLFNSYLGSNYNSTWMAKAAEVPGKAMATGVKGLPYMVAGEAIGLSEGLLGGKAVSEGLANGSGVEKFAYKAIKGAAEGYLGSAIQGESPEERKGAVKAFIGIEGAFSLMPFLGRIIGLGGPKTLTASIAAVSATSEKAIEKANPSTIRGAIVKATAKGLNETAVNLGFKSFWDAQAKGKGQEVINGLIALAGQANKEVAVHNPELVAAQAQQELKELEGNPLGQKLLGLLKQNGSDPVKATVEHVTKATKAVAGGPLERSTVGAASAKSLEFSDNLTKRIQSNIEFENRSHKFLGALTTLFDEAKSKGGKMSKSDNELFNAIQNQLDQDPMYRNLTLNQRLEAGQNVLNHIDSIVKEGKVDAKGVKRFWRSTEVRPGEAPAPAQHQLQAMTDRIEGATHKTGDYVRVGYSSMIGKVVESYRGHVTIELPSGAKYSVAADEVFPTTTKKTEIADVFARRREQASKMLEMQKAEEKLKARQAKKVELEEKQKAREEAKKAKEEAKKAKETKIELSDDEKLKAAFAKAGVKEDSGFWQQAIDKLFPGKKTHELTSEQRNDVNDLSLALKKRAEQGRK